MDFSCPTTGTRVVKEGISSLTGVPAWEHIVVPGASVVWLLAEDLVAAFYLSGLASIWPRPMCFGEKVPGTVLGVSKLGSGWVGAKMLQMGWASAVGRLRHAHRRLALRDPLCGGAGLLAPCEVRGDVGFPDLEQKWPMWPLYLDDTSLVEMLASKGATELAGTKSVERQRLPGENPVLKQESLVKAQRTEKLGAAVDGEKKGLLEWSTRQAWEGMSLVFWLMCQDQFPRRSLEVFQGEEVHWSQLTRPFFRDFDYLWKDAAAGKALAQFGLQAVKEILLSGLTQPLRVTDWWARRHELVTASDASESRGGMVYGHKLSERGLEEVLAFEEGSDKLPQACGADETGSKTAGAISKGWGMPKVWWILALGACLVPGGGATELVGVGIHEDPDDQCPLKNGPLQAETHSYGGSVLYTHFYGCVFCLLVAAVIFCVYKGALAFGWHQGYKFVLQRRAIRAERFERLLEEKTSECDRHAAEIDRHTAEIVALQHHIAELRGHLANAQPELLAALHREEAKSRNLGRQVQLLEDSFYDKNQQLINMERHIRHIEDAITGYERLRSTGHRVMTPAYNELEHHYNRYHRQGEVFVANRGAVWHWDGMCYKLQNATVREGEILGTVSEGGYLKGAPPRQYPVARLGWDGQLHLARFNMKSGVCTKWVTGALGFQNDFISGVMSNVGSEKKNVQAYEVVEAEDGSLSIVMPS
eukprot:s755_g8.t1